MDGSIFVAPYWSKIKSASPTSRTQPRIPSTMISIIAMREKKMFKMRSNCRLSRENSCSRNRDGHHCWRRWRFGRGLWHCIGSTTIRRPDSPRSCLSYPIHYQTLSSPLPWQFITPIFPPGFSVPVLNYLADAHTLFLVDHNGLVAPYWAQMRDCITKCVSTIIDKAEEPFEDDFPLGEEGEGEYEDEVEPPSFRISACIF